MPDQDWFAQNAPKPAASQDWFAANAPGKKEVEVPDATKQAHAQFPEAGKGKAPGGGRVPPEMWEDEYREKFRKSQETPKYQSYMKESGTLAGTVAGTMATGGLNLGAGAKGVPWERLMQFLARAHGAGAGAGLGALAGGASPKEALGTGAQVAAFEPVTEALGHVPGKIKEFAGRTISPAKASRLPVYSSEQAASAITQKEVLEHAAKDGIKLTPGQATGAPVARYAQAVGERSILGANKLAEAMEENAGKFVKSVRDFADRVDPKAMGLSEEEAGEAIAQSAGTAKSVAHENASAAYKNLEWANRTPINPEPLSKAWVNLRGSLPMGAEEQILAQVPRDMRATVEEMVSPTGMKAPLTFEQGINLRSVFRELGDTDALPDRVQAAFKTMTKATDTAMESSATKAGFTKEWRSANAGWKQYVERFGDKQSPLYKVLHSKDPAKVTRDILNRASAKDVEILKEQGMSAALDAMKRQVIQDIGRQKFTVTKDGLGGYSHSFLNKLFEGDTKELYLKANIGRRFRWQENPSGTSNVLLAAEQLRDPSLMASPWGAAKFSTPRDPLSYLSQPGRLNPGRGLVVVPGATRPGQGDKAN
jgi:hypothetical protein